MELPPRAVRGHGRRLPGLPQRVAAGSGQRPTEPGTQARIRGDQPPKLPHLAAYGRGQRLPGLPRRAAAGSGPTPPRAWHTGQPAVRPDGLRPRAAPRRACPPGSPVAGSAPPDLDGQTSDDNDIKTLAFGLPPDPGFLGALRRLRNLH